MQMADTLVIMYTGLWLVTPLLLYPISLTIINHISRVVVVSKGGWMGGGHEISTLTLLLAALTPHSQW